jgi:predicted DNA-binding transcriptional regulator YafY
MAALKHEVLLRLKGIELISYWEGRLITAQLMDWFGISRQQASADIKHYLQAINPGALTHSPAAKGYVPTPGFTPVLTSGHINEYMVLINGQGEQTMAPVLETHAAIASVQLPDRTVRPEVVREIIKACRGLGSLKILYASMTNPQIHERQISPHTLVYSGFRWHVRAWCHTRKDFRDFLLSRIDRTPKPCGPAEQGAESDQLWNEQTTLTLIPNSLLNDAQKSLVERDFGMPDGRLQLKVRKALAHYTLQRYQAAISEEETTRVKEHPLQLQPSDRIRLEPHLFNREGD